MPTQEGYDRRPVPFEAIVAELKRFSERLRSYGINERGRIGEFRRHIEAMIDARTQTEKAALFERLTEQDKHALGIGIMALGDTQNRPLGVT